MPGLTGWTRRWQQVPGDLVLRLTLLILLLQPVGGSGAGGWMLRFPILGLATAGLLIPRFLHRRELWLGLAALTGLRVVLDWPLPDNHAYLLCYWCLAVAISRLVRDGERLLALNARWLVAGLFAFATLWKLVLSPDFVDGTFMHVTLLQDPRFEDFTRWVGGLSPGQIDAAREALDRHTDGGMLPTLAAAMPAGRFEFLVQGLTAWTLVIEAAVAIAFAWRAGRGPSRLRDALLIAFCVTTYAVAPVAGFGWLLVTIGLAQCGSPRTRVAYLATFALILFYREVDWLGGLAGLLSGGLPGGG